MNSQSEENPFSNLDKEPLYKNAKFISTKGEANSFLASSEFPKNNSFRFFAWLISLSITDQRPYPMVKKIETLYNEYYQKVRVNNINLGEKYHLLPMADAQTLDADLSRIYYSFKIETEFLHLSPHVVESMIDRTRRSITLMCIEHGTEHYYTQGFDRFYMVSYLLCLDFIKHNTLSLDFAEAMAYYISSKLIMMVNFSESLKNIKQTQESFWPLDKMISKEVPEIYKHMVSSNSTDLQPVTFNFGLPWKLIWFSDEHHINELLSIWDRIILYQNHQSYYFCCLCTAHVKQITLTEDQYGNPIEAIQNAKKRQPWNINKLIQDSDILFHGKVMYYGNKYMTNQSIYIRILYIMIFIMIAMLFCLKSD